MDCAGLRPSPHRGDGGGTELAFQLSFSNDRPCCVREPLEEGADGHQSFHRKGTGSAAGRPVTGRALGQQQVDVEHLLLAMLDQDDGLVPAILTAEGISKEALTIRAQQEVEKLPKVSGQAAGPDQIFLTGRLNRLLSHQAPEEAKKLTDDFITTEHMLIALTDDSGPAGRLLREFKVTRERILDGMKKVRGNQRVTSQNPEGTFRSLERYGRDLTKLADQGKLDPVIGRDEEIRRVIQVLSPAHEEQSGADRRARRR